MNSILKNLAFFALCAMLVIGLAACGDDDNTGSSSGNTITGTITFGSGEYDSSTDNKPYVVIVDTDDDPGNGYTASAAGTFPAAESQTFTIQNVPDGTYYVFGIIYAAGAGDGAPIAGDFVGVHGGSFDPVGLCSGAPASANVDVTGAAGAQADITVYKQGPCV